MDSLLCPLALLARVYMWCSSFPGSHQVWGGEMRVDVTEHVLTARGEQRQAPKTIRYPEYLDSGGSASAEDDHD